MDCLELHGRRTWASEIQRRNTTLGTLGEEDSAFALHQHYRCLKFVLIEKWSELVAPLSLSCRLRWSTCRTLSSQA